VALALPDEALVGTGDQLDRLGELGVAGDRAVVVTIGPNQIREHLGIAGIGLGARGGAAISIPIHRHRVDREHPVPGGHQGAHEEPAIDLDAHDHLFGLLGVIGDHLVEPHHSLHSLGDPTLGELCPPLIHQADVVVMLGPIDPDEDHSASSLADEHIEPGGVSAP